MSDNRSTETATLLRSINESEAAENIAWWANLRDKHAAKGQSIAVRRCQEEINLWEQELADEGDMAHLIEHWRLDGFGD